MKFILPSDTFNSSQLTTRNILKQSKNQEIRELYKATAPKNIEADTLFHQEKPKNPKDRLVKKTVNKILHDMKGLKELNTIIDSISQQCSCSSINQWQKVCERLPQNIFIFVRKAIILQLANNTNLFRRKKVLSSDCGLCNTNKQTQLHMLKNCPEAVSNGRYTWRHDFILFTICHYLTALENFGFKSFADLAAFKNSEILFHGPRPDIVVKKGNKLTVIELSCCYETNFVKTCNYKVKRYSKLQDLCVDKNIRVTELYVEVFSLGFLPKTSKNLEISASNVMRMMEKLSEVALSSYLH